MIGDKGAASLAKSVSGHPNLTHLNLASNNIHDRGSKALAYATMLSKTLKSLCLFGNQIKDSIFDIAEALQYSSSLKSLDLWCNNIGKFGAAILGKTLRQNPIISLKELCIGNNGIEDEGIVSLAKGIAENHCIAVLVQILSLSLFLSLESLSNLSNFYPYIHPHSSF